MLKQILCRHIQPDLLQTSTRFALSIQPDLLHNSWLDLHRQTNSICCSTVNPIFSTTFQKKFTLPPSTQFAAQPSNGFCIINTTQFAAQQSTQFTMSTQPDCCTTQFATVHSNPICSNMVNFVNFLHHTWPIWDAIPTQFVTLHSVLSSSFDKYCWRGEERDEEGTETD